MLRRAARPLFLTAVLSPILALVPAPAPATAAPDPGGTTHVLRLLPGIDPAARASGPASGPAGAPGHTVVLTSPAAVPAFALVGATWDDPAAAPPIRVSVRARHHGVWGPWQQLGTDAPTGPDEHARRGGTEPLWLGGSDGVQARVGLLLPGGALPHGLRLDLVDPGSAPRVPLRATGGRPGDGSPAARPDIVSRAAWGADESLRDHDVTYTDTIKVAFVHHTADPNSYTCADAPAVIRSIYRYHVQSNGWADIGYNFLVDKCGTVYEGRAGGVDKPVRGAHTLGFNTDSVGVAAMGTYTDVAPPQVMLDGIARVIAWKLAMYGRDPLGKATLTSGDSGSRYPKGTHAQFDVVSGHRDAFATECPGQKLYDDLPALRTEIRGLTTATP